MRARSRNIRGRRLDIKEVLWEVYSYMIGEMVGYIVFSIVSSGLVVLGF